jgi:chromate reductase, NAD(P)H dehydrogenase (quinone)
MPQEGKVVLNYLIFLGSARDSSPPAPARLGLRVAKAISKQCGGRGNAEIIDPLEWPLPSPFKPHFSYARNQTPQQLEDLAGKIASADAYVMVSPEYNHSMSPVLAHMLNHFGSSLFSWKPSLIVTYSGGQWGGTRAAVAMRPFLSELGCLPVSAMIHVPKAQTVLDPEGDYSPGVDSRGWNNYFDRGLDQLDWWAEAAAAQRSTQGEATSAFLRDPSQRNAPGP